MSTTEYQAIQTFSGSRDAILSISFSAHAKFLAAAGML